LKSDFKRVVEELKFLGFSRREPRRVGFNSVSSNS
jgi:hypothetical protein